MAVNQRRSDYRRCLIRTPAELKLFLENTDPDEWTEDNAYALAGIPISVDQLVAEHMGNPSGLGANDAAVGPESMP